MDRIIKEHQSNNDFKCAVHIGNNSKLIKELLHQNFVIDEMDPKDDKNAMQMANLIWRQNDLNTYCNGIWENTNTKLKQNGFWINKL
jgi:hypothetical protein